MPRTRCPGDLPVVVTAVTARTALLTWLMIVTWAVVAGALGAETTTVVSDSMAPALRTGDVVAVVPRAAADLQAGQVLLVDDPDRPGRLRIHRLERATEDGLSLRGDANARPDSSLVRPDAVHGVGVLRFPTAGLPVAWVAGRDVAGAATGIAVALVLLLLSRVDGSVRLGEPCRRCGTPRRTVRTAVVPVRRRSDALVTGIAVALVALSVAASATGASYSATTGTNVTFASSAGYPCFRVPLDDPVLAWDFDEPRGTTVLDRAGAHHGMVIGQAFRQDRSCADGPFMRFTPSSDSPRVVSPVLEPSPETYSLEAWFRTDQPQGVVLSFSSDSAPAAARKDRIVYVTADGRLAFGLQGANSGRRRSVFTDVPVTDGAWHHVVVTTTPGDVRLWLDGRLTGTRTDTGAGFEYDGSWRLGRQSVADWEAAGRAEFLGDIDTVRVYDRVLDPGTITAHHTAGR